MGLLSELSSTTLYLQAIFLIVFGQITRLIRRWYRLRHIPGPTGAGWSSWWQLRGALSGRYHEHLKDAADQFGTFSQRILLNGITYTSKALWFASAPTSFSPQTLSCFVACPP